MHRTNLYLAESQEAALDELARGEGISRSELVRRIIDRALAGDGGDDRRDDDLAAIAASHGVLADVEFADRRRSPDGRQEHLDRIRSSA